MPGDDSSNPLLCIQNCCVQHPVVVRLPERHHVGGLLVAKQRFVTLVFQIDDDEMRIRRLFVIRAVRRAYWQVRKPSWTNVDKSRLSSRRCRVWTVSTG